MAKCIFTEKISFGFKEERIYLENLTETDYGDSVWNCDGH